MSKYVFLQLLLLPPLLFLLIIFIVFCFRSPPSPFLSLSWAKLPGQSLNLNFRIDVIYNAHMIYLLIQMGAGHTTMPRPLAQSTTVAGHIR